MAESKGKQARQKMINLMYLVFIAMLAMQIDQEIIRSYEDTTNSLTETRKVVEFRNDKIFEATLKAKAASSPDTYQARLDLYEQLKTKTNDLVSFISGLKAKMKKEAEYTEGANAEDNFASLNNTEPASSLFFVDSNETSPSKTSADLKKRVEDLRSFIDQNFKDPSLRDVAKRANHDLVTEFPKGETRNNKNWLQYKFYGQPLIAALSNLEVIQSAARNIQSDAMVSMLQEKVDANIKFDAFEAIVAAPDVIIQGEAAEAKVAIGNFASNVPGLSITGVDRTAGGQGFKTLSSGSIGDFTFAGKISFSDANGKLIELPYNHPYRVIAGAKEVAFESGALLSADKMNVLYRGLPNPISGSILGADNATTSLTAAGASVAKRGGGQWTVTPGAGTTVKLTISGKGPKGQTISKTFDFRIKNIPPPVGAIRGSESVATLSIADIPNQRVSVIMPDFDFPVSFTVNSFMFKVPGRAAMLVHGNSLSSVGSLLKNVRSGDIVSVYNINATANGLGDQGLKRISPIVINVQ